MAAMQTEQDSSRASVSLITGSVRGLGLAVARRLVMRGDKVHIVWRESAKLAAEHEGEFPGRVHRADLVEERDATRLVDAVLARDGRLDHVVHCVGAYSSGSLEQTGFEQWKAMFESNLETALRLTDAVRGPLRESRGSLLFFGCAGLEGLRARKQAAAYAAAKSALLVFARSLALEEAGYGVRVNMLSPGIVPHADAHPETLDSERIGGIPMGRVGSPEEIAEAVAWLCSGAAAYTTGADLPVAGGWLI